MRFRPCIDIHNGKVKQIVGSSLKDEGNYPKENFVAKRSAADFARLYRDRGLCGGHIILLNGEDSAYYEATKNQALSALAEWPGGMQIGGGVTAQNAESFILAGASHVIVTSYVFRDGIIDIERLKELGRAVGAEHIVLDLSVKKTDKGYVIVTDRWQKMTNTFLEKEAFNLLKEYCCEFLVHAVDVEGKLSGVDKQLVELLKKSASLPATYAGGIRSMSDIEEIKEAGGGKVDFTVGSALDLFGGKLSIDGVCAFCS